MNIFNDEMQLSNFFGYEKIHSEDYSAVAKYIVYRIIGQTFE